MKELTNYFADVVMAWHHQVALLQTVTREHKFQLAGKEMSSASDESHAPGSCTVTNFAVLSMIAGYGQNHIPTGFLVRPYSFWRNNSICDSAVIAATWRFLFSNR